MRTRTLRQAALLSLIGVGMFVACAAEAGPEGAVHVLTVDGAIDPITERYIDRGLDRAEEDGAKLAVIQLDTPGGLSSSTREIVQRIEESDVPVAVYVSPAGGRAASAGTFITIAAHVAAMAPNTSIGAASAVSSSGGDIGGTLGRKVENDAVAFIRGSAELRGRNADWAESAVREAVAVNQAEALELNVIDYVANDLDDLLRQAEGSSFELRPGVAVTLQGLPGASRLENEMTVWEHILSFLADPTVASLLITIGFFGLLAELAAPGLILPGVAGFIAIALGFTGFGVLPVETVGLVLIAVGLLLLALELAITSEGLLGGAGVLALAIGAVIAFRDTPAELRPPLWTLVVLGVVIALVVALVLVSIFRDRSPAPKDNAAAFIGKVAVARTVLKPGGVVLVEGQSWQAEVKTGTVSQGARVRVVGTDGFRLYVEPVGRAVAPGPLAEV